MPIEDGLRNWPARYKNWSIEFFETFDHYMWVATPEIRKIIPSIRPDKNLQSSYSADVQKLNKGPLYFISENALLTELKRIGTQEALLFLNWLEKHILYPARRKRGEIKTILPVYAKQVQEEYICDMAKLAAITPSKAKFKPTMPRPFAHRNQTRERLSFYQILYWPLQQHWRGQNSLSSSIFLAGVLLLAVLYLLGLIINVVTNEDNYTGAYLLVQWEVVSLIFLQAVVLAWWAVGLMRTALRRQREGNSILVSLMIFICSFMFLLCTAEATVVESKDWLQGWWEMLTDTHKPVTVTHDPIAKRIIVQGRIGFGSYRALEEALKKKPRLTLVQIESHGGYVIEGFAMARLIEKNRLDTVSFNFCESACTFLLAAGNERYLGTEVDVGFHRSSTKKTFYSDTVTHTDYKIAKYYRDRGVSLKFVNQYLETPGYDIWYPRQDYMYISGYATHRWEDRKADYQ